MLIYWYNSYRHRGNAPHFHYALLLSLCTLMKGDDYVVQNEALEDIYKQYVFKTWFQFVRWFTVQSQAGKKPVIRLDGIKRLKIGSNFETHIIITVRKEFL